MPTFNQVEHIFAALAGLKAQLFKDFELIICDDGSTDGTSELLSSLTVPLVIKHLHNRGTAEAINSCASAARGRWWTWVSSDNVMTPDWLEALVDAVDEKAGAAYSGFKWIWGTRCRELRPGPHTPDRLLSDEACYYGPSFIIKGDVWRIAGLHRGRTAHDYDHWARVEEVCGELGLELRYVDRLLCDYYNGSWQTVRKHPELYDAPKWRQEAMERRKSGKRK